MSVDTLNPESIGVIIGTKTGKNEITLDIVCIHCGDTRGHVTLKYKSDKDQGLFRAKCICENCLKCNPKIHSLES